MAWGFLTYVYYLVLIWYFLFHLQPEAIINCKRKNHKGEWRPNLAGLSRNEAKPTQRN
jgi:hypothetical protein